MRSLNGQKGVSSTGWLAILLVAGFFMTCLFKMGPAYLDNGFVEGALKSLATEEGLDKLSNGQIKSRLSKAFTINNVRGDPTRAVEIDRKKDRTIVSVNYEVRMPLFHNVDVVMKFDNELDTTQPDRCCKPQSD